MHKYRYLGGPAWILSLFDIFVVIWFILSDTNARNFLLLLAAILWAVTEIVFFLTPARNFVGLVTLTIDKQTITRKFLFFKTIIPYDTAHVRTFFWWGVYCKVYSQEELEGVSKAKVLNTMRRGNAIIFPWLGRMSMDFPDLYEREKRKLI